MFSDVIVELKFMFFKVYWYFYQTSLQKIILMIKIVERNFFFNLGFIIEIMKMDMPIYICFLKKVLGQQYIISPTYLIG